MDPVVQYYAMVWGMKNEKSASLKNDLKLKYDKLSDKTTVAVIGFFAEQWIGDW